jgi:hypothetical protein
MCTGALRIFRRRYVMEIETFYLQTGQINVHNTIIPWLYIPPNVMYKIYIKNRIYEPLMYGADYRLSNRNHPVYIICV